MFSALVFLTLSSLWRLTRSPDQTLRPLVDPLPQDPHIAVFFNQSEANTYTDPYRQVPRHGDNLEQVIVSANRERELRSEVPAAISTLSPQVIEEASANTLDQVLNKIPGVFVADLANEQHM